MVCARFRFSGPQPSFPRARSFSRVWPGRRWFRSLCLASVGGANSEFKVDEWGADYGFSAGVTITSTGSGQTLTRQIANSTSDLLFNFVTLDVTDLSKSPPGSVYKDSVRVVLVHPDGTGNTVSKTKSPSSNGFVQLDSIPIGNHLLRIIYIPDNDTLTRRVILNPGTSVHISAQVPEDLW